MYIRLSRTTNSARLTLEHIGYTQTHAHTHASTRARAHTHGFKSKRTHTRGNSLHNTPQMHITHHTHAYDTWCIHSLPQIHIISRPCARTIVALLYIILYFSNNNRAHVREVEAPEVHKI